jgi:nicotinamidase/pyrazinamidase
MSIRVGGKDALIVVDYQRDFCPGGALAVEGGDEIASALNSYVDLFEKADAPIYATRDWHPSDHVSFKERGGQWPPHCIMGSNGAEFQEDLELPESAKIISKGTDPGREAYSGFEGTDLEDDLKREGIARLFVGGLATDYCVKNTVLDGLKAGFEANLLRDATRAVNLQPGDGKEAINEMVEAGADVVTMEDLVQ